MGAADDPCGDNLVPDLPRAVVLDPRVVGVVTHFNRLRRAYGAQQAGQGASLHDDRALRWRARHHRAVYAAARPADRASTMGRMSERPASCARRARLRGRHFSLAEQ